MPKFRFKDFYLLVVLAFAAVLAGCQSANNVIGYGAVGVKNAAVLIQRECGNVAPDGPCLATSKISTTEKNEFKVRLQQAQDALVDADRFNRQGMAAAGKDALARADAILSALEAILIQRGIE
jgi:ABC-type uncharacterized transport system auxiliary subunit